jgi:hypothetical protein
MAEAKGPRPKESHLEVRLENARHSGRIDKLAREHKLTPEDLGGTASRKMSMNFDSERT